MKFKDIEELAKWNDEMVTKYHKDGTLFESKNFILALMEKNRLKQIIKLSDVKKEDTVLDLGCGEGHLLNLLPEVKEITGLDISKVALSRANTLLKDRTNIKLLFGSAEDTKFENNSFDKIFCSEVLEHVPDPKKVIEEIYRILKKDGILVVSIPDEKRIKTIMNILDKTRLKKLLYAARKDKDYEWHLHEADLNFLKTIVGDLFHVDKIKRVPFLLGYRFVIKLKK
ncbi:hypothetical protein CL621_03345 [archaeon]|nr:hypothetical protein [archaeon]